MSARSPLTSPNGAESMMNPGVTRNLPRRSKEAANRGITEVYSTPAQQFLLTRPLHEHNENGELDRESDNVPNFASRKRIPSGSPADTPESKKPRKKRISVVTGSEKLVFSVTSGSVGSDLQTLFGMLRSGRGALQSIVDDWLDEYKKDREGALVALINFFINSSGCKGEITRQMYAQVELVDNLIQKMTEYFEEETGDYPIVMAGPAWKKFKSNFVEFLLVLVRQCQHSIIYDQYLMDNVITFLTGMSVSYVRAFRHTGTLAAMKLMSALVNVAITVNALIGKMEQQYETEMEKVPSKRSTARLETLQNKKSEYDENLEEIKGMMNTIFNGVFVHRYRDIHHEIRAICMGESGIWIKLYPDMFMDDSYLRYTGWNLSDRHADVRLKCIMALHSLYCSDDIVTRLELFTSRFKDRIVGMTLDKKAEVSVQAIKLITYINSYSEDILEAEDCENIYQLVYASNRNIAQAAGQFLNQKLFTREDDNKTGFKNVKRRKKTGNAPLLRDLAHFFVESELHETTMYLVDSLWEINDMLKDWECMTSILMYDASEQCAAEDQLDSHGESIMIDIMTSSTRQASDGQPPVGRGGVRKLTGKEKQVVVEDRIRLTTHFIQHLPILLSKYINDPEKVCNLVQIPQFFDLEIYTTGRLDKFLDPLLKLLSQVVERHPDAEVLRMVAKTFLYLHNEEFAIYNRVNIFLGTLLDTLSAQLRQVWTDFQETDDPDETLIYQLTKSAKNVEAFCKCHDVTSYHIFPILFTIMQTCEKDVGLLPDAVSCRAIAAVEYCIVWELNTVSQQENPSKEALVQLFSRTKSVIETGWELFKSHPADAIKEEAYILVCDLLVDFARQLANREALTGLVYQPSIILQRDLLFFINHHVFVSENTDETEDEKIETLHNRRNLLACFCKLIMFNIVKMKLASEVFRQYLNFFSDYGDIIKATMAKCSDNDKILCAKTLNRAISNMYRDLPLSVNGTVDRTSEPFTTVRDLAKSFSQLFGIDHIKSREALATLHTEGILFALSESSEDIPPNLSFLEILTEFSSRLMKQDKRQILAHLDRQIPDLWKDSSNDTWLAPINHYRFSLLNTETDQQRQKPHKPSGTGAPRGRPKKRLKKPSEDEARTAEELLDKMNKQTAQRRGPLNLIGDGAAKEVRVTRSRHQIMETAVP